jgi:hypothetical protein
MGTSKELYHASDAPFFCPIRQSVLPALATISQQHQVNSQLS